MKFLIIALYIMLVIGCSTKMVIVEATTDASISLVNPTNPTEIGQVIGSGKAEIALSKISDKFIKVSAPNKFPQIIMVTDTLGVNTKMNIVLQEIPKPESPKENNTPQQPKPTAESENKNPKENGLDFKIQNLISRMLLKSYQSLSRGNYKNAAELAQKITEISPTTAAPHIIIGLSQLKQGLKSEANSSFSKAKALDPEDTDIDKLMKIAQ